MISRRGLFRLLAGAAASPVIEKAARSYFFAPIGGWESDVILNPITLPHQIFLTNRIITAQALEILLGNLELSRGLQVGYESNFAPKGARIGDRLDIRKPMRFTVA